MSKLSRIFGSWEFGLIVFMAVATTLFSLLLFAYAMRMREPDWQPIPHPSLLWWNTGALVLASIAMQRARQMTDQLLQAIHRYRAKIVVIDLTGVASVDSMVANHLLQAVDAAGLLGATVIVTGISADVAQTVVRIGVDLTRLHTAGDLQSGVAEAARSAGFELGTVPGRSGFVY